MKAIFKNTLLIMAAGTIGMFQSCSLNEENPGGYTLDNLATSEEGYETLLNNCYFGLERYFYGSAGTGDVADGYMPLLEGCTDLWTYKMNDKGTRDYMFWFYAGGSPNTTYTNNFWNGAYDGIGACNLAIQDIDLLTSISTEARNQKLAEARFLRAIYYYNLVELFGAVTMNTTVQTSVNYAPTRTDPLTIYKEVIIPDLQFAADHLTVGTDATLGTPTKKAALGFLAKACLSTKQYGTDDYVQMGLEACEKLIADCTGGGSTYGAYMYPTVDEVFAQANNMNNKEALWKNELYADASGYGSSNGNYRLNRNHEYYLCQLNHFGARIDDINSKMNKAPYYGGVQGVMMPTQHLIDLYRNSDGTLDPRFHKWFTTEWVANNAYTLSANDATNYDKNPSLVGTAIAKGDKAIKFVVPGDADYATEVAAKATSPYILVDYKDVYQNNKVIMTKGAGENNYRYFYPSLNKFDSDNFYVANEKKQRVGNLNAFIIMRMAEVYLLAAEAEVYLGNAPQAIKYLNVIRQRAGVPNVTACTLRTILDERGRELCGEMMRFFDLKRMGFYADATYLNEVDPELGQYFNVNYVLRPISTTFTATISNGAEYQNPGY